MSDPAIDPGGWGVWKFQARLRNVVDGDTIDVDVDMGFQVNRDRQRLRIAGVDTAETYGTRKDSDEYALGKKQTRWVTEWLTNGGAEAWPLVVITEKKTGKYGRYIADVQRKEDGEWLVENLLAEWPDAAADY